MRTLGRYVFREIVSSALIGTFLATCVIFLQKAGPLVAILVRSSANLRTAAWLFALSMPSVLPLTIPFGVLVGILIGLGRLAADGEVTAMRAAGVPGRRVVIPVLLFAFLSALIAGAASIKLAPLAVRESKRIISELVSLQLTADIQPRVFEEQFPKTILYVSDVRQAGGNVVLWRNVFLADLTPPAERPDGLREKGVGPRVTVAREALAVPDPEHNRIQLSLSDASSHEMSRDAVGSDTYAVRRDQALDATPPPQPSIRPTLQMSVSELRRYASPERPNWIEARIELHRRFALPFACIMLALVGIPLGISMRKGGKSSAYVWGVFLAFFCYYLLLITLIGVAKQRTIPVEVAVWTPNAAFGLAGLLLLIRLEKAPGRPGPLGRLQARLGGLFRAAKEAVWAFLRPSSAGAAPGSKARLALLPQILDAYVLRSFGVHFLLVLAAFVSMTEVYNFFELMGDMVRNSIPLTKVLTYLLFLTPMLIYETLPISVLVAVLVTFGVLTKNNEVTAFKACGVSVHRLAVPILVASAFFSAGLFALDHYYLPGANRIQDALRNEIKGRPAQSYLLPDRKWIRGRGSWIYYYRYFDPATEIMADVSVYKLDPKSFDLVRQISAERARWQPSLRTWVFENGWYSDFHERRRVSYASFAANAFPELNEEPRYFRKEVLQDKQMNTVQLDAYIRDLQQSGFDTVPLQVQFYRKFSVPLFALIMALISIPFGFLVGNRGAMAGIGVSIGIAIAYWGIGVLFEQVGNANQLPPVVAAWSPDAAFSLTGLYLLLRLRS